MQLTRFLIVAPAALAAGQGIDSLISDITSLGGAITSGAGSIISDIATGGSSVFSEVCSPSRLDLP